MEYWWLRCEVNFRFFIYRKKNNSFPIEYISRSSSIYKSILWGNCEGVNEKIFKQKKKKILKFSWERELRVKADDDDDDDSTYVCSYIL